MSLFDFVKEAGRTVGIVHGNPTADELKTELDSHKLGTENVTIDKQGDTAIVHGEVPSRDILERAVVAIGNTVGISKVETDVKVATHSTPSSMYTVKKGDTLSQIAEAQYGKGKASQSKLIFEANQPMLKSADKIYPGQVLRVPALN